MQVITDKINNIDREKRIYLLTILLSVLIHLFFLLMINQELFLIDFSKESEDTVDPVTIVFPENRPTQVVENINENEEVPEASDLLSDKNSRARNPDRSDPTGDQPLSDGNIPFANLTQPNFAPSSSPLLPSKKFSKEALSKSDQSLERENFFSQQDREIFRDASPANKRQETTDNIYEQKQFSADQMGDLTLSTYAWEWAPYINAMKRKLRQVWFAPAAYTRLGLIYGYTRVEYTISKEGNLLSYQVLEHKGHESLEKSSVNAITSLFPFKPLPSNFPDETLTITALLIYPNLREGNY